ncbi:hypothetical protein, partial [Luteococcus sediminum]
MSETQTGGGIAGASATAVIGDNARIERRVVETALQGSAARLTSGNTVRAQRVPDSIRIATVRIGAQ